MRRIKIKIRKPIIKLCILISIIGVLSYLMYLIGYVPIIGNLIAEKKLSNYATIQKGNTQKVETKYDWYNAKYQSVKGNLSYRLQRNTIYDENVSEKVSLSAETQYNKIKEEFPQNLSFPKGITVWTEFDADNYSIKSQRLYLLGVYNTEDISEEESKKMCATIADKFINLMGEDYNFTGIQIIYYDKNGGYESAISSNGFKKLDYGEILSKTEKVDRLPEDYLNWLSKQ
ncbi:hypothetical protein [Clostridium sp.]|uniref:hypothetical protein n=1 Tax=Clostridium sp. TaxID=1506 RepID=UPI002909DD44|nr:hypothetical protein [Clostridium sp.]MDU5107714.1 hypothetical protein [Clostridium sp.]